MSSKVLYRKYRSQSFDEVVGQSHITETLKRAVDTDSLAHSYLFVGPIGVGKTSVARILGFSANDIPYSDEGHVDIIEIDAASNRRIDEIRELRDKIHIAPVSSKYKVYIIDEVHMLTREAFNALLKTLEEPPSHVIFVLATTEAHKVPDTIVSRTQRFVFKPIDETVAVEHLKKIAKLESIEVSDDALLMIARYGQGSFRDSIGLLDQLSAGGKITGGLVRQLLGYTEKAEIDKLLGLVEAGAVSEVSMEIGNQLKKGVDSSGLSVQLIDSLRGENATNSSIELIQELLEVSQADKPYISLEIALLKSALKNTKAEPKNKPKVIEELEVNLVKDKAAIVEEYSDVTVDNETENQIVKEEPKPEEKSASNSSSTVKYDEDEIQDLEPIDPKQWLRILNTIKTDNYPLYAVLRLAEVNVNDNHLILTFQFAFHAKRLDNKSLVSRLREIAADIRPTTPIIKVEINKDSSPTIQDNDSLDVPDDDKSDVAMVMEVFGGGEIVEL